MRNFTLLFTALVLGTSALKAQTIATFESLPLAATDTYYVNYTTPGTDVGFTDALVHFPCVYDTGFGASFLSSGWVYSDKTDSVTSGYTNQYSAKAGIGWNGSAKYLVAYCFNTSTYENTLNVRLTDSAVGKEVNGFYVTNSTYAFNSMRDGDGFAKKFGGTTGTDADWFKLTVRGYTGGALTTDSVNFMLADFTSATSAGDSIVRDWRWVNLLPLGHVDSLQFKLTSSDNGSFGMNTPSYFCIDNFNTKMGIAPGAVAIPAAYVAKVYPNPVKDMLFVDLTDKSVNELVITDAAGRIVIATAVNDTHIEINTATLPAGTYMLQLKGSQFATVKFVK